MAEIEGWFKNRWWRLYLMLFIIIVIASLGSIYINAFFGIVFGMVASGGYLLIYILDDDEPTHPRRPGGSRKFI